MLVRLSGAGSWEMALYRLMFEWMAGFALVWFGLVWCGSCWNFFFSHFLFLSGLWQGGGVLI